MPTPKSDTRRNSDLAMIHIAAKGLFGDVSNGGGTGVRRILTLSPAAMNPPRKPRGPCTAGMRMSATRRRASWIRGPLARRTISSAAPSR